ncbi:MAG: BatA domain-containing protein [Planctomycetaceae bacterium]
MPLFLPPAFGLASPWLLLGLGLAAVPVIIHLLFRRPYRDVPWAATRFLLAATKKHAKRLRLEQLVLLAVRIAALLLVATALARPYFGTPRAAGGPDPPRQRVIVLDTSYSMGHEIAGQSRLDLAKAAAREVVDAAQPGDAFHLVRMSRQGPRVLIGRPSYQAEQVAAILDEQAISFERADAVTALRDVKTLLGEAPELPDKEVLILSDFQQADWRPGSTGGGELRTLLDGVAETATVRLFDAARPPESNVAVTDLNVEGSLVRAGETARLTATVRMNGDAESRRERVELHVDGRLTANETVELRSDEEATVSFSHVFAEPGPHAVEVRLPHDAVAADDSRFLAVAVRGRLRVLLVNGRPAGPPEQRATFYLRQALSPAGSESSAGDSDFEPVVIDEGELAGHDLAGYDAVVLSNVGIVTEQERDRLRSFAASGGGVVLALGDNIRPSTYNHLFADAGDRALLPIRLIERVGDPVRPDEAIRFDAVDVTHAIVRPFAGNPGTGLDTDFVLAYAKAELAENTQVDVPLRFGTGDPAIVAAPIGAGRIVLLTSSVDTTWAGPWPQTGRSFLPLVHETIRYAATGRPAGRTARIGDSLVWNRPDRIAGLTASIRGPDGLTATVPATVGPHGLQVAFDETNRPGVYTLSLGPPISKSEAFAVNVDPTEGDLTPLPENERIALVPNAETLVPGLSGGAAVVALPDWTLSRWLLAIAFGLLVAEQVLAWRFAWGLIALLAVAVVLLTRWGWLVDPYLGTAAGLIGTAIVVASIRAATVRERFAVNPRR